MKLIFVLILIFFTIEKLYCRSANEFLKDVFSLEDEIEDEVKCTTMECQTAGKFT